MRAIGSKRSRLKPLLQGRDGATAKRKAPRVRGFRVVQGVGHAGGRARWAYDTIGSLKASISPSKALIGTQLQNTFLSP